ncbi:glycosyltransferase family 4 protein [bacterium]|nr:glycosyltransferase family 4 protein [bacterium]
MPRLRIVHIITKLELGGAQQNTLYTVANLNHSVFEPHLISGPGGILDDEARELKDVSVRFCGELSRPIRPVADYQAYQQLRQHLKEIRPDIVHTHSSKAGVLGRLAASAEKVPVIIHTYHGFGFHRYQNAGVFKLYVALEREASRRGHHLIFVSKENRKWAEELDLLQNCSDSLIRSGVEIDPLLQAERSDAFREQLGIPKKGQAVAMIACLKPQKDPLTFVEAADIVSRKMHNAKFLLIGDGEMADAVLKRAAKMRYAHNFVHLGWRREIPEILANLDLVVLPSLWEGLPRVIPEATIAGIPVIASDIDGIREIIFDGRNGALAEPQNPQDFAEKILTALDEEWKVDSDLSRVIQHEFDIREMVRQQESLYLKLASTAEITAK